MSAGSNSDGGTGDGNDGEGGEGGDDGGGGGGSGAFDPPIRYVRLRLAFTARRSGAVCTPEALSVRGGTLRTV